MYNSTSRFLYKVCISCLIIFSFTIIKTSAQVKVVPDNRVGIGTNNPNASAKLHVNSDDQGFLLPRIPYELVKTSNGTNSIIQNPVDGLQVYLTSMDDSLRGVYVYDGGLYEWIKIGIGGNNNDQDPDPTNEIQDISTNGTSGNLTISDGSTININVDDSDPDPTNELQTLSQIENLITLSNGGGTVTFPIQQNEIDNNGNPGDVLQYDGPNIYNWVSPFGFNYWTENGGNVHRLSNVGIGTETPSSLLHVNSDQLGDNAGDEKTITQFQSNTSNQGVLETVRRRHLAGTNWKGTNWRLQRRTDVTDQGFIDFGIDGKSNNHGLGFGSQNNTHMVLESNGRLGLGTNNPAYKFHVTGDTYIEGGWLRVSGNKGISFEDFGGGFRMIDDLWIRTFGNKQLYVNKLIRTDGGFQFGANGSKAHFMTNGYNGFGVATPTSRLHVNGNQRIDNGNLVLEKKTTTNSILLRSNVNNNNGSNIYFDQAMGGTTISDVVQNKVLGNLVFRGYADGAYQSGALIRSTVRSEVTGNKFATSLDFYTRSATSNWKLNAMLDGNGNFGIGTASPSQRLHIKGNQIIQPSSTAASTYLKIGQNRGGEGDSYIDLIGDETYSDYGLRFIRKKGVNGESYVTHRGTGRLTIRALESAPITFQVNNTERMRVHSNGNVGIGRTSPAAKLDVNGDIKMIENQISNPVNIVTTTGNGVLKVTDLNSIGDLSNYWTKNSNNDLYRESNVGIGTDAPIAPLHVVGRIVNNFPNADDTNIAIGNLAGNDQYNQGMHQNIFIGNSAGEFYPATDPGPSASKIGNTFVGFHAGRYADGRSNNFYGAHVAEFNTGDGNTIIGDEAGLNNAGDRNNILGYNSAVQNSGNEGIALGSYSAFKNDADSTVIIGYASGYNNKGYNSILIGRNAGFNNEGTDNIFIGTESGKEAIDQNNVFVGNDAGKDHYKGWDNVMIGKNSGSSSNTTNGLTINNSVALGSNAKVNASTSVALGNSATVNAANSIAIGNNAVVDIANQIYLKTGDATNGKVVTDAPVYETSDSRFKSNIKGDIPGLDFVRGLNPVSYNFENYKYEQHLTQSLPDSLQSIYLKNIVDSKRSEDRKIGFLAQDVDALCDKLDFEFNGLSKPNADIPSSHYSIAYSQFVVPLVKAVQEQQEIIDFQDNKIVNLENEAANNKKMLQELLERVVQLEKK